MAENRWLFWTSLVLMIVLSIGMSCFNRLARVVPINYICLMLFTLFTTYFVAAICAYIDAEIVLLASILTMTVFFALTFLTFFVSTLISLFIKFFPIL